MECSDIPILYRESKTPKGQAGITHLPFRFLNYAGKPTIAGGTDAAILGGTDFRITATNADNHILA